MADSREKKKVPSLLNPATFVTIYVGIKEARQKFVIHKDFATHYSPVFKAAFNSDFVEGRTQTYVLEDTTEEAVRLLVQWIYTQTLDVFSVAGKWDATNLSLVHLWVLADKLLIPSLQNQVLQKFAEIRGERNDVPTNTFHEIYRTTAVGSSLRRLILHQCAYRLKPDWYTLHPEDFPKDMLIELATLLINNQDAATNKKFQVAFEISKLEVPED